MAETIDSLQIEISASGSSAAQGLANLKASLEEIKKATKGGLGLRSIVNNLQQMSKVNGLGSAAAGVTALATGLETLGNATRNLKISSSISKQLQEISNAASGINSSATANLANFGAALSQWKNVGGIKISASISHQITKIGEAAQKLQGVDLSGLSELAKHLTPLAALGKSNLSSFVTQLAKIPDIVKKLDDDTLTKFASKLRVVSSSLSPLSTQLSRVDVGFAKFNAGSQNINNGLKLAGVWATARGIAKLINESNEYVENLNLFTVALGEYAGQAQIYADKISDVMGIDPSEWMRSQGVFYTLADGFGIAGSRAYLMSKNLTQLGYDISSFFNIPVEESMQKLQSGISGEIEPLRRLGYDLSQTKLQAIAATLGIKESVSSMTQAEKAQLRYYAIMTQVTSAQGDMARTLNSPANQLRILQASVTQTARALGNIFIPVLNAALPVAIALAKAVRAVAVAIASLFGYSLPSVDFSVATDSIGGISDGMDNVADSADKAGGSAKKLQSILMGFDEINQIPDTSGGGGSGGSGGSSSGLLSGFDFELPEYDFLSNMVGSQADAIYRKMEPVITWIRNNVDWLLANVSAVAGGFLSWKIAKSLIPDLSAGEAILANIKAMTASLVAVGIMVALVYRFDKKFAETGNAGFLIADGLSTFFGAAIVGRVTEKAFGINAMYGASISLGISAITTIKALYDRVSDEGWDNRAMVMGIVSVAKGAIAGGLAGVALGVGGIPGAVFGAMLTLGVSIAATLIGIKRNNIRDMIKWGDVELEAEEVRKYAENMFSIDVASHISVITDKLDNEEAARISLNNAVTNFEATLNTIRIGAAIDNSETVLASLQTQAETVVNELTSTLQAQNETVQVAMSIVPASDAEGNDISAGLLASFTNANSTLTEGVQDIGRRLSSAIADGMVDGMSDEEQRLITELSASLGKISRAVETGKVQGEFAANMQPLLSELTEDSFNSVIEEYVGIRDELEESYRNIQVQAYADMQGQLAGLSEYLKTIDAASDPEKYSSVAAQIAQLQEEMAGWDIDSSVAKSMEEALAPVRQQWLVAIQSVYGEAFTHLDFSRVGIDAFTQSWSEQLSAGLDMSGFKDAFDVKLYEVFADVLGPEASYVLNMADKVGLTGWDLLGTEMQQQVYNMMVAAVGKEDVDALFAELGYSIPGTVSEAISEAGGITVTPSVDSSGVTDGLQDAADTAGETASAIGNIGSQFESASSTATEEMAAIQSATDSATQAITATGSQAEALKGKIVEIPVQTVIDIHIDKFNTLLNNLSTIRNKIIALSNYTIDLKVKAGLSSGAKTFLRALANINATLSTKVTTLLNASQFAGGGYPNQGELFIANEAGAEMVGRIGNRTAVANQEQIGEAIFRYMDAHSESNGMDEERLASAIVSALRAAGLGTINIDGRALVQAINRETQRIGRPAIR